MRISICLAIWCFIVACEAQSENGYIFTCPRSLKTGSSNELQLFRFRPDNSGILRVRLYYSENYNGNETLAFEKEYEIEEGKKDSFYQLQFEPFTSNYIYNGRLEINGTMGGEEFGGSDKVYFSSPKSKILLIQTDKPLYQPGQQVFLRVLKVNKELKPSENKHDIAEVYVEDPKGTRLFEFKRVHCGRGLVQMDFPLSDDPVLGTWRITVNSQNDTETTTFEVKRYVLPKFEVKIKFPDFVLANAELIPVEICAKYTYGKNVVGTLNLNSSLETYAWSRDKNPILEETFELDGCKNYTMNVTKLEPNNSYRYRRVQVVANVIEKGTGVQMNATEYLQRQYSPLNLNFNSDVNQRQYFKPGLPIYGKLKVTNPDDTPASCEPIEICATISRERIISNWFGTRKDKFCKNYTSDDDGIIKYALPPQNTDSTSVFLEAKSLKYARNQGNSGRDNILNTPETSMSLSPFYSPSGSFIQLATVGHELSCGEQKSLRLLFTSKEDADYKFQYQVISKGEVVLTGTKDVSFKVQDDVSSKFENDNELINDSETQIVPAPNKNTPGSSSSSSEEDECPAAKEARYVPPIGETKITIPIDANISPSFTLLVFYRRGDREVVADSQKFQVQKCFKNQVDFEFGDEVKQPATKTTVKVTASPNSLCGIKVVDKSITLLDSSDQLTAARIFQLVENMDSNIYYTSNPCNDKVPQPGLQAKSSTKTSIIRPPPGGYSTSSYEDSLAAFQNSGYLVISDLILFTRPCTNDGGYGYGPVYQSESFMAPAGPGGPGGPARPVALASVARRPAAAGGVAADAKVGNVATKSAVEVRDYFPETWLFKMEMTGPNGVLVRKEKLPHTITEWIGSAVCVNPTDGLGISNSTSIKGFQAFFISYTLPVSMVRGEVASVVVSIFSYADGALPITVSLDHPEGFEVTDGSVDREICVQPDTSSNIPIKLKATSAGKVNITVRAETASSSKVCDGSTVSDAVAKDAITQPLTVDPEGYPQEETQSNLFCPTDNENQKYTEPFKVSLPDDVVPDSYRAYIDITGNVMGKSIENLNDLVALPTGCGEQNMVKFTPNYLVLNYMESIGKLTEKLKATAIRNLNTGYQRELNYRHSDGSFSAFGETDKEGSMFLTAFVLRSFCAAQQYITVDPNVLSQMQTWIASKQAEDGHFPNVGRIVDYGFQGGIEKEKNAGAITAYVLAALLVCKYENETVVNKAKAYLKESDSNLTPYETFLYAYAEALGGDKETAQNRISEIKPRANTTGGLEFYNNPNGTKALNLETVAYAVLANLECGNGAASVLPLVRYMTQNLNPRGGFYSTQDTCVGLDGLSQFAELVYKDPVDILVSVSGDMNESFEISEDNKLLVQRKKVPQVPSDFVVDATGSGCGVVQVNLRYNTYNARAKNTFQLGVTTECLDTDCKRGKINVATSYIPEGKAAGMSVVEIKMISGYSPDKEVLQQLSGDKENNILRADVENNKVIFYFSEITNAGSQFSMIADKVIDVENVQPASIKVYDYYVPENVESTSYTFGNSASESTDTTEP